MSEQTGPDAVASADSRVALDPGTPPAVLAAIAEHRPELRVFVAMNPATYPGLAQWLATLSDPAVDAALATRDAAPTATQPTLVPAPPSTPPTLSPGAPQVGRHLPTPIQTLRGQPAHPALVECPGDVPHRVHDQRVAHGPGRDRSTDPVPGQVGPRGDLAALLAQDPAD